MLLFSCFSSLPFDYVVLSVIDCCHSGTVLDLPYVYHSQRFSTAHKAENQVK